VSIAIENLPPYEQISHPQVREAVGALDAMKVAREQARRDLIACEQEDLELARQADAETEARCRREGKKPPAKRVKTEQAERRLADLAHELLVQDKLLQQAHDDVLAALDELGTEWATEVGKACEDLTAEFHAGVNELIAVHARLLRARKVAQVVVGGKLPTVGVIELDRRQLQGIELAQGSAGTAFVQVSELLTAISSVGQPEPEPEPQGPPGPPLIKSPSPTSGVGAVDQERAERDAFIAARLKA
jgi:hypothetical protein